MTLTMASHPRPVGNVRVLQATLSSSRVRSGPAVVDGAALSFLEHLVRHPRDCRSMAAGLSCLVRVRSSIDSLVEIVY